MTRLKTMDQLEKELSAALAETALLRNALAEHGIRVPEGDAQTCAAIARVESERKENLSALESENATLKADLAAAKERAEGSMTKAEVSDLVVRRTAEAIAKAGIRATAVPPMTDDADDDTQVSTRSQSIPPAGGAALAAAYHRLETDEQRQSFIRRYGARLRAAVDQN